MTKEEAIKHLYTYSSTNGSGLTTQDQHEEAKKMAIKALEQPGWTYIEEALPETIINKHTNDYQEYNCLCDFGDYGFDVRTYKFGNGHFWNGGGIVDKYVTAWQPLPEIPDALKPQPWEGGEDE